MTLLGIFKGKKENTRLYYNQEESIMERINKKDKNYLIETRIFIENIIKEGYSINDNDNPDLSTLIGLITNPDLAEGLHDIRKRANVVAHEINIQFDESYVSNDLNILDQLIDYMKNRKELNKYEFFSMIKRIIKEKEMNNNRIYSTKDNSINFEKINNIFENDTDVDKEYYTSSYNTKFFCMKISNDRYYSKTWAHECPAIFYVIHNILIRKDMVRKSKYLNKFNLNNIELDIIRKYEIIILHAMKYGAFCFEIDKENNFEIDKNEVKYAKIACENILYYANILNKMQKTKNNINYIINIIPQVLNKNEIININNKEIKYEFINNYNGNYEPSMWFTDKINYEINEENKQYYVEILNDLFGYKNFRTGQLDVIKNILENKIINIPLAIFPTGYGKSLIYQYCAILEPQKTIVICPTEVLACDQIFNLNEDGLNIGKIISCYEKNLNDRNGNLIYYTIPEVFLNYELNEKLVKEDKKDNIYNIVLDECHNISLWGHQFDPIYFSLSKNIINSFKNCNVTMFTATASELVINDIKIQFPNNNIEIFQPIPLDRQNIKYKIIKVNGVEDIIKNLTDLYSKNYHKQNNWDLTYNCSKTLIINNDKDILNKLYNGLQIDNYILPYVSIFNDSVGTYKSFRNGNKKILLSDDDFVVGINIPELVNLVCIGVPPSKEWLYQESGRVGRNLEEANVIIYIPNKPSELFNNMIDSKFNILNIIENKSLKSRLNIDVSNINYFNSYFQSKEKQLQIYDQVEKGVHDNIYVVNNNPIGELNLYFTKDEKEADNYLFYMLCLMDYIKNWQTKISNDINIIKYRMFVRDKVDIEDLINCINNVINVSTKNIEVRSKYYRKNNEAKTIKELLENLLDWYYETIISIKREMLINTYELLSNVEIKSEEIESNLALYFRISDKLRENSKEQNKIVMKTRITKDKFETNELDTNYYSEDINLSNDGFENEEPKERNIEENNKDIVIKENGKKYTCDNSGTIISREAVKSPKCGLTFVDENSNDKVNNIDKYENLTDTLLEKICVINNYESVDFEFIDIYKKLNETEKYNLQFILQRLIETGYIYGYEMVMAILDLENNGTKLLRFKKFAQNTNKQLLEILMNNFNDTIPRKNKRQAYKIIYNIYKPQNFREWLKKYII